MRWVFASVLVVVAGAVAAFAIYTWGWRETGGEAEQARAEFYAHRIALRVCDGCIPEALERRAGTIWTVTLDGRCHLFDTERVRIDSEGTFIDGVVPRC